METNRETDQSPEKHRPTPARQGRLSSFIPTDLNGLIANGYAVWSGEIEAGAPRPKTKNVNALLAMGYLKWTAAGREARTRRIRQLKSSLALEMPAEKAAAEEQTLP